MDGTERFREPVSAIPDGEVVRAKQREGWRPVAIEWVRDVAQPGERHAQRHPIPYGLRIAADCSYLEIDDVEKQIMSLIIAMIADDHPLSKIAEELNRRQLRTRQAERWTQVNIFKLLPRVIEFGPEILSTESWGASKKKLLAEVS